MKRLILFIVIGFLVGCGASVILEEELPQGVVVEPDSVLPELVERPATEEKDDIEQDPLEESKVDGQDSGDEDGYVNIQLIDQTGKLFQTLKYDSNFIFDLNDVELENFYVAYYELNDERIIRPIEVRNDMRITAHIYNKELVFETFQAGYIVAGVTKDLEQVIVPSEYNGKPVVGVKENALQNSVITSIVLPKSIEFIGVRAFESSLVRSVSFLEPSNLQRIEFDAFAKTSQLQSISLPEGLRVLGQGVFYLSSLQKIDIPSTLQTITRYALSYSMDLERITVAESNPFFRSFEGILYTKTSNQLLFWPPKNDGQLIRIPPGTVSIADFAFDNNIRQEIALPESLMGINNDSFHNSRIDTIRLTNNEQLSFFIQKPTHPGTSFIVPNLSNPSLLLSLRNLGHKVTTESEQSQKSMRVHSMNVVTNGWVQTENSDTLVPFTSWSTLNKSDSWVMFVHANRSANVNIQLNTRVRQSLSMDIILNDQVISEQLNVISELQLNNISLKEGYNRIEFSNFSLLPQTAGLELATIQISVDEQVQLSFSPDTYRRMPASLNTFHTLPNKDIEWIYSEITVEENQDVLYTYFMANGFAQGYFGMQANKVNQNNRWILFSVWSPYETDDPSQIPKDYEVDVIRSGPSVQINSFGNEGSGRQSYLEFAWKTGVSYGFLTRISPVEDNRTSYESYFYDPTSDRWFFIAEMERPFTSTYAKGFYSFIEVYVPNNAATSRYGLYDNYWARTKEGEWIQILQSITYPNRIDANNNIRYDYVTSMTENGLMMQTGGFDTDNNYASRAYTWRKQVLPSHLQNLPNTNNSG